MLHVRHALMNKSVPSSPKQQRKIAKFTVLMTTRAHSLKSLILCIYFNSAQTNVAVGLFVNIVKCEQDGILAKQSKLRQCFFQVTFFLPLPSSLLKLPTGSKPLLPKV